LSSEFGRIFINGTPTPGTAATYKPIVTLNDSGLPPAPMTMTYSIVISNPPPPVVSNPLLLPGATINQPFSYTFSATAGLPPYSNWKETGTLPAGITPLTSAGVLAGTPTVAGAFPISVTVEDSLGQVSAAQGFTLQVYAHGFKADGAMGAARTSHTATLFTDGTALLAGGLGLATAEKYDPSTGKFTPTAGSMSVVRYSHTATLLTGGKVLITGGGGRNGDPVLATAEVFDPGTGKFTLTTGNMSVARTGHNATLLSDGKVLITGGGSTTADLYDPSTGKFSPTTGSLVTARNNDTATLLPNGKVLITGGFNSAALATDELYDPTTETFSATGSMGAARLSHTATLLTTGPNTGKVLVAGGANTSAAELYDPATGSFSSTGSMAVARSAQTATLLGDGTILMAGGGDTDGITAASELYDPNSGKFSGTGGMQTPREAHTATLLKDGTALVTGGVNQAGILATAEIYQ
jgi:WD40 repeat protein